MNADYKNRDGNNYCDFSVCCTTLNTYHMQHKRMPNSQKECTLAIFELLALIDFNRLVGDQIRWINLMHRMSPPFLGPFVRIAAPPSRRALRSASTSRLVVPTFKRSAVGDRTFQISGSRMCNELPEDIATAPSLAIFGVD